MVDYARLGPVWPLTAKMCCRYPVSRSSNQHTAMWEGESGPRRSLVGPDQKDEPHGGARDPASDF
ncbi:hypothetical protein VFPFJ_01557 [Purpureocillium lilacinum]|uniref:Uncharacterized protein n=1 Tax=Purpureocillium lilacinum TaxID=33203 RepID=A0A179HYG0_PURLI|nr:hypothetical protein VFPFJ_01557 [Purpureocillium lilacinum]OAQ95447.1 hypothetical protein VFPFJ_01557 [Purpureocillium lilacinum]